MVKSYPDVRGLAKNMFFFHHTHAEGGTDEESTSKFNTFEVRHSMDNMYVMTGDLLIKIA